MISVTLVVMIVMTDILACVYCMTGIPNLDLQSPNGNFLIEQNSLPEKVSVVLKSSFLLVSLKKILKNHRIILLISFNISKVKIYQYKNYYILSFIFKDIEFFINVSSSS